MLGKKVGATSDAVQRMVGLDQPDFGELLDDCLLADGDEAAFERFIQPRAEGEIAFLLDRDVAGPGVTAESVLTVTDYVSPCIEIVDSRIRDWRIRIVDTIADNASCGAFVIGEERVSPHRLDLAGCAMRLSRNGVQAASGLGAASLGHPARAVAWLASKLSEMGECLRAGEPILSGSLGQLVSCRPEDGLSLTIASIGECSFCFGGRPTLYGSKRGHS